MTTTLTVVLPAFEVQRAMPSVVRDLAVARYALRARDVDLDVVLLTGDEPGTAAAAEKAAASYGLDLVVLPPSAGPGEAFLAGFAYVLGKGSALVATMDANGRHDAAELPRLVDVLLERERDVVIGSRWARGSGTPGLSPGRWALGRLANLAFRGVTGIPRLTDATTSFRVVRSAVLRDFSWTTGAPTSHAVQTALVAHAVSNGFRVAEAPIIYRPSLAGGPGLQGHDVARFGAHLVELRRTTAATRRRRLAPGARTFTPDSFGAVDDLERLGTARHFFAWVLEDLQPHLRGRVLEVGAGVGTITRKLVDGFPGLSVVALEPAANVFGDLDAFARHAPAVDAHQATLGQYLERGGEVGFDAVLYLNVLEHVEDDKAELRLAAEALRPGGALLLFVPALERLYSELDLRAGHYRRYDRGQLRSRVERAGLTVQHVTYFDLLGVLPYWLVYRLLHHDGITGSSLWGYDRLVVPFSRLLQHLLHGPPVGKNLLLVAVKP